MIREMVDMAIFRRVRDERDHYRAALEHIAVHGDHGQECRRPPQEVQPPLASPRKDPDA